jgi:inner membrane protein
MDTLTHALSGALLARATAPAKASQSMLPLRRRVALGALAAAFPDCDVVVSWMSPLAYLYHHRGVTHSLVMLALWTLVLAWLCAKLWRGTENNGPGWRAYAGVIGMGIAAHIAGDWITSFGTMVFAPLLDFRAALSTTFIIDLWFSGIIIVGLAASWVWRRSRHARWPAVAGLGVLCGYVVFQFAMQQRAIDFGRQYALANGLRVSEVTALPRPLSPFNWMVVVDTYSQFHYSLISLNAKEAPAPLPPDAGFFAKLGAPYLPLSQAKWQRADRLGNDNELPLAREVMLHPKFEFFRWFAAYPVLYRIDQGNPSTCVWFQDLRFFTPGRAAWPFRYGMCREVGNGAGEWRPYELLSDNSDSKIPVY